MCSNFDYVKSIILAGYCFDIFFIKKVQFLKKVRIKNVLFILAYFFCLIYIVVIACATLTLSVSIGFRSEIGCRPIRLRHLSNFGQKLTVVRPTRSSVGSRSEFNWNLSMIQSQSD